MKKAKKPIALLLVLLLFVSLLPAGALAADDAEPAEEEEVLEVLLPEEDEELPAEEAEEAALPEEEPLPPEEEEEVLPEEPDDIETMAEPEEEDGENVGIQADDPEVAEDEETGLKYTVTDDEATVSGYTESKLPEDGVLTIPATLGGYPVTAIGPAAFYNCRRIRTAAPSSA